MSGRQCTAASGVRSKCHSGGTVLRSPRWCSDHARGCERVAAPCWSPVVHSWVGTATAMEAWFTATGNTGDLLVNHFGVDDVLVHPRGQGQLILHGFAIDEVASREPFDAATDLERRVGQAPQLF